MIRFTVVPDPVHRSPHCGLGHLPRGPWITAVRHRLAQPLRSGRRRTAPRRKPVLSPRKHPW